MVTTQRDYYKVLDVPRDTDAETITQAFKYHPDKSKEADASDHSEKIQSLETDAPAKSSQTSLRLPFPVQKGIRLKTDTPSNCSAP